MMRLTLIASISFLLNACSTAPKGVTCVIGHNSIECFDPITKKPSSYLYTDILKRPENDKEAPINYVAISDAYLQALQTWGAKHCQ